MTMRFAGVGSGMRLALCTAVAAAGLAMSAGVAEAQQSLDISSFTTTVSTSQAGYHADVTTSFELGTPQEELGPVEIELPSGLVGNPQAAPPKARCTLEELESFKCPASAQIGFFEPTTEFKEFSEKLPPTSSKLPVYDLTPNPGQLATLGIAMYAIPLKNGEARARVVEIQVNLRDDGTYGLTASIVELQCSATTPCESAARFRGLRSSAPLKKASLTLWGVPAEESNDELRDETELGVHPGQKAEVPATAFMTNPSDCSSGSLTSTLRVDLNITRTATFPRPERCDLLRFSPTISVTPDTSQVDSPAGYDLDLKVPQNENPKGLATPDVKSVSVMLPSGTSLSPSAATGLEACSEAEFSVGSCPSASQLGTVSITSPPLPESLVGSVYLGAPTPSQMYKIFLEASAPGVTIRLLGEVHADPNTGQLTISLEQSPQLPFSDLHLSFFGGPTAVLANPQTCGPATSESRITSYGGQSESASSTFVVDADGHEGACPASPPFSPNFSAGMSSPLAADFGAFSMRISRTDGEQDLSRITAELPPGLLATLSGIPFCEEPQASQGDCPPASQVGTVTVGIGPGSQPLNLTGLLYLTGPYRGRPFGLSIVVPVDAGPFELGTIVKRAWLQLDPTDLHLTIGLDPLPQILDGIPLRTQMLSVTVDRPSFMFNPTDCSSQAVTSTIGSSDGTSVRISAPLQASGCSGLPFTPTVAASTLAKASSRGNGASLQVKVVIPRGQANLRGMIVTLPSQLRPRLSTIQHACLIGTLLADPAGCPAESWVGVVTVRTPVLASPLVGPVYLASRGASAYPDLVILLQSQGIEVELDSALNVSRQNRISSALELPDVPLSSFLLELPEGPHSMLGTTKSLCSEKLKLPYAITAQNGHQVGGAATVAVDRCPKPKRTKASSRRNAGRR